jgi:uncharacterized protein
MCMIDAVRELLLIRLILTVIIGFIGAQTFHRLKLPIPYVLGSMSFVLVYQLISQMTYFPMDYRFLIQASIGTYIGLSIKREHLRTLKTLYVPIIVTFFTMLLTMIISSLLIVWLTDMTLITAMFATVPGGVFDMALVSMEYDANITSVAIMQISRLIGIVIIFPFWLSRVITAKQTENRPMIMNNEIKPSNASLKFLITLAIGIIGSLIGNFLRVPAGALSFAMIFVALWNLISKRGYTPSWFRRLAQIVAGSFLATQIQISSLSSIFNLFLPIVIMLTLFITNNFLTSKWLSHHGYLNFSTAIFSTSPAGAAEMVIMANEYDRSINITQIALMHIIRLSLVISIFPIIIKLIFLFING